MPSNRIAILCGFALPVSWLLAQTPPHIAPVVIDANCSEVADAALPLLERRGWLKDHGPHALPSDRCTKAIFCFDLETTKIRNTRGLPIFNFTGRYADGGDWRSMLTRPNVSGSIGTLRLTEQTPRTCAIALEFRFETTVSTTVFNGSRDADGVVRDGSYDFVPGAGPWVSSNGRLEREYAVAIEKAFTRRSKTRAQP